jgi:hypothetical protein
VAEKFFHSDSFSKSMAKNRISESSRSFCPLDDIR